MIDIQGEMADHMTNELKDNDNFYLVDYLYQSDPEKLRQLLDSSSVTERFFY